MDDEIVLALGTAAEGAAPLRISNRRSGRDLRCTDSDWFVVLGGRLIPARAHAARPAGDGAAFASEEADVRLAWTVRGDVARLEMTVTARRDGVRLDQAGLWRARLEAPARLGQGRHDVPADLLAPLAGVLEAHPVFVGDDLFAGIDWPAAENACSAGPEGRILCREFPGVTLARGQAWTSHPLSIGVCDPGGQAEAFIRHLGRLRGRPTRRASFYFDWLTHASEGPSEAELAAMIDLLGRLRERHGLRFDFYALDDGAVETRWGLYWDRYRLQHRRRFPGGLPPLAARLGALGTALGLWIGPDGFGPDGTRPRAAELGELVRACNVGLLKIDTCVSWPWRPNEAAANDAYLRRFDALLEACRAARPDLVAINHRVTSSPYVLTMLDSTLWEGAESYPDVFLNNTDRPRLHTRYAAYARGLPTYYGAPSDLLEDHGVCFNGDPAGWRRELCVGAFGRALALSPELYGTLFLLPDDDYRDLAAALERSRELAPLLALPGRTTADGDFVRAAGGSALLCLLNDAWSPARRILRLDAGLGLPAGSGPFSVVARFPRQEVLARAAWGDAVAVDLAPFEALAVEVRAGAPAAPWADAPYRVEGAALVLRGAPGSTRQVEICGASRDIRFPGRARREPEFLELGALAAGPALAGDRTASEACRFATSNDPPEWRLLQDAPRSGLPEVNACRAFFREKLRHEGMAVAENAWDGDPATAWGDAPHWTRLDNLWRLDLGVLAEVGALEIDLADFGGGPVFADGTRSGLQEPLRAEASADLAAWSGVPLHVFYTRNPFRTWPSALIAEFPAGTRARYLRLHGRGFAVQGLRVLARADDGALRPLDPAGWRGTNLFGAAPPVCVYHCRVPVDDTWPGRTVAVVAELPEPTRLQQEVAHCWAEVGGAIRPAAGGSPRPLFHAYEYDAGGSGPGFVWRLPVTEEWVGADVRVALAWLGARGRGGQGLPPPAVRGYLLSDGSPEAEVRLPL